MVRLLITCHWRCETFYSKFKLHDNHCHWTPQYPCSAGETSACGQECLEVEMETTYVSMLIKWPGNKFASSWTTCINPPKDSSTVWQASSIQSKFQLLILPLLSAKSKIPHNSQCITRFLARVAQQREVKPVPGPWVSVSRRPREGCGLNRGRDLNSSSPGFVTAASLFSWVYFPVLCIAT